MNDMSQVKPRIYLASRYSRREELCEYRSQLIANGHNVQARWLDGKHQLSDRGIPIGDNGEAIVEGVDDGSTQVRNAELRAHFANDDWEDVTSADIVVSFTEPPRSTANRGGRHVEFGIALALGARVIVVGHRENIFHWLPQVQFCETWEAAIKLVNEPLERVATLQSQLTQAHKERDEAVAACAVKHEALMGCNEMFDTYGHTSESPCVRDKEIVKSMLAALSTDCDKAFLERMKEAEWLIANVHGMRDEKTREWFERQQAWLKGGGK